MMSPYAFYQFWLNAEDEKVGELLRIFTFLCHEEIEDLEQQTEEKPFLRAGQRALAEEVTTLVHGAERDRAHQGRLRRAVRRRRPARPRPGHAGGSAARDRRGRGTPCDELPTIVDLLVTAGLCESRAPRGAPSPRAAPTSTTSGSTDPEQRPAEADVLGGDWLVLRRGKKSFAGVRVG